MRVGRGASVLLLFLVVGTLSACASLGGLSAGSTTATASSSRVSGVVTTTYGGGNPKKCDNYGITVKGFSVTLRDASGKIVGITKLGGPTALTPDALAGECETPFELDVEGESSFYTFQLQYAGNDLDLTAQQLKNRPNIGFVGSSLYLKK